MTLRRDEGGLRGFARLDLAVGKRITRLNADLTFRSGDGITRMQTRFDNIAPAELADRAPELQRLAALGMVLRGSAEVRLDRSFTPLDASLRVSGNDGVLTLPEFYAEPLKLASVELAAIVQRQGPARHHRRFQGGSGGTHGVAEGGGGGPGRPQAGGHRRGRGRQCADRRPEPLLAAGRRPERPELDHRQPVRRHTPIKPPPSSRR